MINTNYTAGYKGVGAHLATLTKTELTRMAKNSINTTVPFKSISLNKGKAAIVDAADYDWLMKYSWHYIPKGYAIASINGKNISMHRLINNTPKGAITDHIDGNKLNNRRSNLRTCSHHENCRNRKLSQNCASNFKGVNWHKGDCLLLDSHTICSISSPSCTKYELTPVLLAPLSESVELD